MIGRLASQSSNGRSLFDELQSRHAAVQFVQSSGPPSAIGSMWSTPVATPQQYEHGSFATAP
jgi:hypothetical protein